MESSELALNLCGSCGVDVDRAAAVDVASRSTASALADFGASADKSLETATGRPAAPAGGGCQAGPRGSGDCRRGPWPGRSAPGRADGTRCWRVGLPSPL